MFRGIGRRVLRGPRVAAAGRQCAGLPEFSSLQGGGPYPLGLLPADLQGTADRASAERLPEPPRRGPAEVSRHRAEFLDAGQGEQEAGVTLFYVGAGIDTGDVAGKRIFPIRPDDTLDGFIRRAKREACDLALETLDRIEASTVERTPLEGKGSYFGFPTREAYREFRRRGRRLW